MLRHLCRSWDLWRTALRAPGSRALLSNYAQAGSCPRSSLASQPQVFYKWSVVKYMRLLSRLKLYQVSCMGLLLGPMVHWYHTGVVGGDTLAYGCGGMLGATGVLVLLSYYFQRFVGQLAYLPEQHALKVSTLTFMGGRRDRVLSVESIVPFADSQSRVGGVLQVLEVAGREEVFLYSLHYGTTLDKKLLNTVLLKSG